MNSIFVEALYAFKVSYGNIIRDRFVKTKLPPLSFTELTTNTQAYSASVQVPFGSNYEEVNEI